MLQQQTKPSKADTLQFREFDLLNTPLAGVNLIEANAGTGKTYTISRLFLRLILEKEMSSGSILVVTFTEAATQELKVRIYSLLQEALTAFNSGKSKDEFFSGLIKKIDNKRGVDLLTSAIRTFDNIAIYTIHGFCRRVLHEHSFECGSSFDSTVITDQKDLIYQITCDFWRIHFYKASEFFVGYGLDKNLSIDKFLDLSRFTGSRNLNTFPHLTKLDCTDLEKQFSEKFDETVSAWPKVRDEIEEIFNRGVLKGNKYTKNKIDQILIAMDQMSRADTPDSRLFKSFELFTSTVVQANVKKGNPPVTHWFFDSCDKLYNVASKLWEQYDNYIIYLKSEYLVYLNQELAARKQQQNLLYFDDMLLNVHKALTGKVNGLADTLRKKYRAALIDEFQDTDPVQYQIFSSLFFSSSVMFLIGDPKQAIYSFRGADIHTYIGAAQAVDSKFTLSKNYRSSPDYLETVNTLFSQSPSPFLFDQINYKKSTAGKDQNGDQIEIQGVVQPSLKIWFARNSEKRFNNGLAGALACDTVVSEIGRLLQLGATQNAKIGTDCICPSDVAVLVRTNNEAEQIKKALASRSIPAVIDSGTSVFSTEEAVEIQMVLKATAEPGRTELLKAALTTRLFGMKAGMIDKVSISENEWEELCEKFFHYHELWRDHGFDLMIRTMINNEHIRAKLLCLKQGERALTNILHLCELIHLEETKNKSGISSILKWLDDKIRGRIPHISDDEIIRLETDREAVKIVTIHKSKGLEYRIVFCPFMWHGSDCDTNEPFTVHDPDNGNSPLLVLSQDEAGVYKNLNENETLAENLRILYVALTRAVSGCYLFWGDISSSETSAMSYLLFGAEPSGATVQDLRTKLKSLPNDEVYKRFLYLERENRSIKIIEVESSVSLSEVFQPVTDRKEIVQPSFKAVIPEPWSIASFTSLSRSSSIPEMPDYDIHSSNVNLQEFNELNLEGIHAFPRGAKAGTFLHDVLEKTDYSNFDSVIVSDLVKKRLTFYGYDHSWADTVSMLISTVTRKDLSGSDQIRLCDVQPKDCLKELQFFFPLQPLTHEKLRNFFEGNRIQTDLFAQQSYTTEGLVFSPAKGYIKGFIDLVFRSCSRYYIVDWKSNFLGPANDAYDYQTIFSTMHHEHYILQYHLYLVALHRYLKLRLKDYNYEKDFGGVFYIFLRGITPDNQNGIFFDRPSEKFIEGLSRILAG